jgi:RNA recognition motif-containing protein
LFTTKKECTVNIYVGNLPREATEADVRDAFEAFGEVTSVALIKDKFTGEPRGFGFVEMPAKSEAEAAIAGLNGKQLKGHKLTVNEARPREERRGGPDRRGGGFDRGGGGQDRRGGGRRF